MVVFWFLLALVLLVLAVVLLRLDAKQRGGGIDRGRDAKAVVGRPEEHSDDDDEAPPVAGPADDDHPGPDQAGEPGAPQLAPFQRSEDDGDEAGSGMAPAAAAAGVAGVAGAGAAAFAASAGSDEDTGHDEDPARDPNTGHNEDPARDPNTGHDADTGYADTGYDDTERDEVADDGEADTPGGSDADGDAVAGASTAVAASTLPGHAEPEPLDPTEPAVESSPRLLDKVRALLPARRQNGRAPEQVEQAPADPLAGSPIVRWLEDRAFEPTPTPAPEFRHGDFALGLSALGTVSHGMFRGRRAIMGVTGGRTVLALRRDTASDVVLDLSRPDVDSEPGFHDAGQVGTLEARTSDYGRLDLIDRGRLVDAVSEVPADVRRIWAESEWVAATIDGVDDPSTWDDVVAALHSAADVLAPFPPIGGRARALPAEIDPGAPGGAAGPDADPTIGMDGEVGTGTQSASAAPGAAVSAPGTTAAAAGAAAVTGAAVAGVAATRGEGTSKDASEDTAGEPEGSETPGTPEPRRTGHLRLVPDRSDARDLTDEPVVADRGDADPTDTTDTTEPADPADTADSAGAAGTADAEVAEPTTEQEPEPEADPFAEIMEPSGPVHARGDVAADHLAPRPPLSRPTRGVGQAYPEDASVPPLASGATTGGAGIKPLGSEDDEDEIRDEVQRFDAARIDGGSDFDEVPTEEDDEQSDDQATATATDIDTGTATATDIDTGTATSTDSDSGTATATGSRHGADDVDPSEVTQRLSVADLAARMGVDPAEMRSEGRRRRAKADDDEVDADTDADADPDSATDPDVDEADASTGTRTGERPGIDPDVEQTAKLRLPPDIRD